MHKIFLTGAAGLVGQNLCLELAKAQIDFTLVGCDKNLHNLNISKEIHSSKNFSFICEDLAEKNANWMDQLKNSDTLIICHAQISSLNKKDFFRNNVQATQNILDVASLSKVKKIIHISSSVVNSEVSDEYVKTKTMQEDLVVSSNIESLILRPTLMFGMLDRKHFGWLARFLKLSPIFPIPGDGKYVRQPLYANDFCRIIISSIDTDINGIYDISGLEEIEYIEIIKLIKSSVGSYSVLVKMPVSFFKRLLRIYSLIDSNPPFTADQADALVTPETFPKIDWPTIFQVKSTDMNKALTETFTKNKYSKIKMEF